MDTSFEKFLAPIKELNDLTLKSIEQITEIQVKAIQESAKASIDALKASAEIKDLGSMQDYLKNQVTVAKTLSDYAVEDARQIASLSNTFATDVKGVVEKSVQAA